MEAARALFEGPVSAGTTGRGDGQSLLFVTDRARLAANIGRPATDEALSRIPALGGVLLEGPAAQLFDRTRQRVQRDQSIAGIVLLGGVDVVPSRILLTVPLNMQASPSVQAIAARERDRLQVWSDDRYGDRDDDGVPEIAVSRIPDGKDGALMLRALRRASAQPLLARVKGIRNSRRPFADLVYSKLDRSGRMLQSESEVAGLPPYPLQSSSLYVMLHGHWREGNLFRGEDEDGYPEAFRNTEIPDPAPAVVFSGCCYGALVATQAARDAAPDTVHASRVPQDSIALTFLARGANAFVGCTAIHYSPDKSPFTYLGEPMHRYFWREITSGQPPARALLNAKRAYAAGIPHLPDSGEELRLIEHKILRQFTCLGLGW